MLTVVVFRNWKRIYMVYISACFPLEPIKMRNFQGYFSRTFHPGIFKRKKARTFQKAWEPWAYSAILPPLSNDGDTVAEISRRRQISKIVR